MDEKTVWAQEQWASKCLQQNAGWLYQLFYSLARQIGIHGGQWVIVYHTLQLQTIEIA